MDSTSFRFPASFAQQRMWFLDRMNPGTAAYNIPAAFRFQRSIDPAALKRALQLLVDRHEVLRTTFEESDDGLLQVVHENMDVSITFVDFSDESDASATILTAELVAREYLEPFDLENGPLWRSKLIRTGIDDHLLLITIHHSSADGWSMGILENELRVLYDAVAGDRPSPLTDLPIQYVDYVNWQRQRLDSGLKDKLLSYWTKQLNGIPSVTNLYTAKRRVRMSSMRGATQSFRLSTRLSQDLVAMGIARQASLFMTLLAAFYVLLSRYSGSRDLVVATPVAGRSLPEFEGILGCFLNNLLLRADLSTVLTFSELLTQVRNMTLEAFENQELPFELLVKAIEPKRNESHNPLFQIMFVLQNAPRAGHLGIAQLADEHPDMWPPTISYGTSKFDLSMSAAQSTEGLIFSLEYSTDLFEDAAITRMLDHYRNILKHVTAEPDVALSNIRMLSEDEYNKIVYAWNDVEAAFRDDVCIHQRVEETVDRVPDTVALVFQGEEHTYGELDRRANRLAHRLVEAGVQPGYRVALLLERSLEIPVAMLAVLKAGGVYVPIEPELPDRRIELLLKDVEPAVVVTRAVLADRLPTGPWRVLDVSHLAPLANGEAPPDTRIPNQIGVDSLAYIIYTSGSTGQPKGVMVNHRSVLARLDWMVGEYKVSPDDCFIQRHPYSFDVSVWEYFLPLFCGSRLLLLPPGGHKDLALMRREMEKYQVTIACFLPSMLSMFLDEPGIEHLRPHLRLMLCGAETMQSDLPHRYYTHFGGRLDNLYGPTEACIHCTYWRCVNATLTSGPIPIGKPQSNTRIYILDEMMRVQPPGLPGEIYIGGPGVARGYWKRPDISERVFLPNHLVEGDRLYKTGDLAMYLPSGDVEFIGRLDGQVKVRGYRVEPGEVHHVLVSHPCVREAAVIPRDDLAEGLRLAAYVVPQAEQAPPTRAELRTFLEERLPGYMVPSAFVFLERLPLTQNGKLDHQALPAPKIQIESEATAYTEPRTDTERSIADIWCSLLGLEFVGIHDDFFQLGGDSLLATCVVARIRSRLGIELPLRKVFDSSRLEQMAKIVDGTPPSERQTETCPITRVRKQDGGSCA